MRIRPVMIGIATFAIIASGLAMFVKFDMAICLIVGGLLGATASLIESNAR